MAKAREETSRTRNRPSNDPAALALGVSEAVRSVGATLDRFNSQFLDGVTKLSESTFRRLPTGEQAAVGPAFPTRTGEGGRRLVPASAAAGMGTEFDGAADKFDDTARAMSGTGSELTSGLEKNFHNLFEIGFKGELRSAENSWKGFCDSLENTFSRTLSRLAGKWMQQAFQGIFNSISGAAGSSLGSGSGASSSWIGEIFSVGSDSVTAAGAVKPVVSGITDRSARAVDGAGLATAAGQAGERSTRNLQAASADRPALTVNVEVINQTGTPAKAEQGPVRYDMEKAVVGVVLKNYNEGGSIWQMIRGEKGQG